MTEKLTDDEHTARAMLLGMRYHHGNGIDPFYYKVDEMGVPRVETFIDANTMEPLIPVFDGLAKRAGMWKEQDYKWIP